MTDSAGEPQVKSDSAELRAIGATNTQSAMAGVLGTINIVILVLAGLVTAVAAGGAYFIKATVEQIESEAESVKEVSELFRRSIDDHVSSTVSKYVTESNLKIEFQIDALKEKFGGIMGLAREVESSVKALERYEDLKEQQSIDYSGPFLRILEQDDVNRESLSPGGRQEESLALDLLISGGLSRKVSADILYNGSSFASRNGFVDRAHRLATLAHWIEDSAVYAARVHRLRFETGENLRIEPSGDVYVFVSDVDPESQGGAKKVSRESLNSLMQLVRYASLPNCELIYSEAWNAIESSRNYPLLIDVLESSLSEREGGGEYFPSYGHAILAQLYARMGDVGWRDSTNRHIILAETKVSKESPNSTWFNPSVSEISQLKNDLKMGNVVQDLLNFYGEE